MVSCLLVGYLLDKMKIYKMIVIVNAIIIVSDIMIVYDLKNTLDQNQSKVNIYFDVGFITVVGI